MTSNVQPSTTANTTHGKEDEKKILIFISPRDIQIRMTDTNYSFAMNTTLKNAEISAAANAEAKEKQTSGHIK